MDQNGQFSEPNEWQAQAFVSQFANSNNANQEDFVASPFAAFPMLPLGGFPFPQLPYNAGSNGDTFMTGDFQPEVGLYNNDGVFMQNQLVNAQFPQMQAMPVQNMSQVPNPNPTRVPTELDERAAALKKQLLKGREQRSMTKTPPVASTVVPKPAARPEVSSLLRNAPIVAATTVDKHDQELNINELISQFSASSPAAKTSVSQNQTPNKAEISAKSQASSSGSPAKVANSINNGKQSAAKPTYRGKTHSANNSISETSEGEIREETAAPAKPMPPTKPREQETPKHIKIIKKDEKENRKPIREEQAKPLQFRGPRVEPPARQSVSSDTKVEPARIHEERREASAPRSETRKYDSYHPPKNADRPDHIESERPSYPRRELRADEFRRPETTQIVERAEADRQVRESKSLTLENLLQLDEDLRIWLDITSKILTRRKQIAELDAQRDALLAEMEIEERAGIPPPVVAGQTPACSTMLPPPIPNRPVASTANSTTANSTTATSAEPQRDRVSSKRPYSDDLRDPREDASGKLARLEERNPAPRIIKSEDYYDYGNSRTRGSESRFGDRGRPRSRERDISPGRHAFENRPAARRTHEDKSDDRSETQGRAGQYVVRGNYRGRAFNPDFHAGRGRGRGGRGRDDSRDREPEREFSDLKNDSPFGSRIANGRPYRGDRFDRGGKGGL